MATLPNKTMLGKEVLLKKINIFCSIFFFLQIVFYNFAALSKELDNEEKTQIISYITGIEKLSSDFIQFSEGSTEQGRLYLLKNRIKIDYLEPSKITIIISKNKAMYFNKELQEIEYFNPQKNEAIFLFNVFNKPSFFEDAFFSKEDQSIRVEKKINYNEEIIEFKVLFEKAPILIRKIILKKADSELTFSFINTNFHPNLSESFFSMANPLLN